MTRAADQLEKFKFSAKSPLKNNVGIISVGPYDPGAALKNIILESGPLQEGQRVLSAKEKLLDHNLNRQRFSLRFLSLIVLPATFLVSVSVSDDKIKTSCFGIVSLIVGALVQESGSQRNSKIEEDDTE